jgi:hypothetical protein
MRRLILEHMAHVCRAARCASGLGKPSSSCDVDVRTCQLKGFMIQTLTRSRHTVAGRRQCWLSPRPALTTSMNLPGHVTFSALVAVAVLVPLVRLLHLLHMLPLLHTLHFRHIHLPNPRTVHTAGRVLPCCRRGSAGIYALPICSTCPQPRSRQLPRRTHHRVHRPAHHHVHSHAHSHAIPTATLRATSPRDIG